MNYTRCSSSELSRPEVEGTRNRVWSTGCKAAPIGSVTRVDYVRGIEPVIRDTLKREPYSVQTKGKEGNREAAGLD